MAKYTVDFGVKEQAWDTIVLSSAATNNEEIERDLLAQLEEIYPAPDYTNVTIEGYRLVN